MKQTLNYKILFISTLIFLGYILFSTSHHNSQIANNNGYQAGSDIVSYPETLTSANELDLLTPSLTQALSEPADAIYLEGNFADIVEDIKVKVTLADGSFREVSVTLSEETFGEAESTSTNVLTSIIGFDSKIIYVDVYNTDGYDVKIKTIILQNNFRTLDIDGNYEVKKLFYQNLDLSIVAREDWGAASTSPWAPFVTDDVNKIVVHHTASSIDTNNPQNTVRLIYEQHKLRCSDDTGSYNPSTPNCDEEDELWMDIGYNYLIDHLGNIYEGRVGGNGVIGAHSPPNTGTIGIAVIGNFTTNYPTAQAQQSLSKLMAMLGQLNEINLEWGTTVQGHNQRNVTLCPGAKLDESMNSIVSSANSQKNSNSKINNAVETANKLFESQDNLIRFENKVQLVLKTTNLSENIINKIKTDTPTGFNFKETSGALLFYVDATYATKTVKEIMLYDSNLVIQPNYKYKAFAWDNSDVNRSIPDDYDTNIHWNLEKINLPEAWKTMGGCAADNLCGGSNNVVVAIADTGVAYEDYNYDAGSNYQLIEFGSDDIGIEVPTGAANGIYNEGYDRSYFQSPQFENVNFVNAYDVTQDLLCQIREGTANPCNATELEKINHANDDSGHGTFVASIIAANTGGTTDSIVGISHNVKIMPIKVFFPNDSSFCYDAFGNNDPDCLPENDAFSLRNYTTTLMIRDAIDHARINNADVINLSIGGTGYDLLLQESVNSASNEGTVIVAAAGNTNTNVADTFPAGMDNVIAVGAVKNNNAKTYYSNFGSKLDLVAPVGDSLTTPMLASLWFDCSSATYEGTSSYDICFDESMVDMFNGFSSQTTPETLQGTSFAAPQVTAAVALIKSYRQDLNSTIVRNLLVNTATDVGSIGFDDNTGYGIVNVDAALNSLFTTWVTVNNDPKTSTISPETIEFNNKLYQFIIGENNKIYLRISVDGVNWSAWKWAMSEGGSEGQTVDVMGVEVFNNRLYLSVKGKSGNIFTKSMNTSGVWDANWNQNGGISKGGISMEVFQNKLYQVIIGKSETIYIRYTEDGYFDNNVGENWVPVGGMSPHTPNIIVYNDTLYLAVTGKSTKLFVAKSTDGVFNSVSENYTLVGGESGVSPTMIVHNNNIYLTVKSATSNEILTKYSSDGTNWNNLTSLGGNTSFKVSMVSSDISGEQELYQYIRGKNGLIYYRTNIFD